MLPTSEELEAFFERLTDIQTTVARRGAVTLRRGSPILSDIGSLAKEWLQISQRLRAAPGVVDPSQLARCDDCMSELLGGKDGGRPARYYYRRLGAVQDKFMQNVVVPVVKHAGDPKQVATRQLKGALDPHLTQSEKAYVEEALKCVQESCNRAAIVLLWASAITRFHNAIEHKVGFNVFSKALAAIATKKVYPFTAVRERGPIASRPELQRVPEFAILVVGMEVWNYDLQVFGELSRLLDTRNNAAHPGMGSPGLLDVEHFTTKLVQTVFAVISP